MLRSTFLLFILFLASGLAKASQEKEINEFCRNKEDVISCVKDYEGIPKLNVLPYLPKASPIPIKIIPYSE